MLREVYKTGTDAEIQVARRCFLVALEAAGLVPPLDQICNCPDVVAHYLERPGNRTINPTCPWHGNHRS